MTGRSFPSVLRASIVGGTALVVASWCALAGLDIAALGSVRAQELIPILPVTAPPHHKRITKIAKCRRSPPRRSYLRAPDRTANDLRRLDSISAPTAIVTGAAGLYALADRQLIQTEPGSPATAYRGLYAGATFDHAPARAVPISHYYEARLYGIGLLPGRSTDLASLVYNHQVFSHYLADLLNPFAATAAAFGIDISTARRVSNATTISYLAHLRPGFYASVGLGYTDHPSALYFQREGGSPSLLAGL